MYCTVLYVWRYIAVTSDLGRVTTLRRRGKDRCEIAVTSDLGRVTTKVSLMVVVTEFNCGDVRSRTSYNKRSICFYQERLHCGDVRSRTSYNFYSLRQLHF